MTTPIQRFTLEEEGNNRGGLACDASGVTLASAPLLTKTPNGFQPRPVHELDLLLKAAYGAALDTNRLARGLAVTAEALNRGDVERAMIGALHLRLPPLSDSASTRLANVDDLISKYNYNPEEPRDWRGRWTTDGGGAPPPKAEAASPPTPAPQSEHAADENLNPVAYNGRYHDQVEAEYADYLRSKGEIVLTEVSLRMADGSVGARLDILARDPKTGFIYGVEIKTGQDPGFTPGQVIVYAHAMMGESVVATEAKVVGIGLLPNLPLPPIPIFLMWQVNAQSKPRYKPLSPENMARRYRGEPSLEEP